MRATTRVLAAAVAVGLLQFLGNQGANGQGCGFVTKEEKERTGRLCADAPVILRPMPLPENNGPRIIYPLPPRPAITLPPDTKSVE